MLIVKSHAGIKYPLNKFRYFPFQCYGSDSFTFTTRQRDAVRIFCLLLCHLMYSALKMSR